MSKKPIIVFVGRPNVGKSTLFNRLSVRDKAIVHKTPGVTRDRKYSNAQIGDLEFTIVDTPGLEEAATNSIQHLMKEQAILAMSEADMVCLVVDGRAGVVHLDKEFANLVRQNSTRHMIIVNKCERNVQLDNEFYQLGLGDIAQISAEHGLGIGDLYHYFKKVTSSKPEKTDESPDSKLRIAIVGRPNAGKSTLINTILGDNRLLTSNEAGTTRESIEVKINYNDTEMTLIDTAGLRRRSVITESLEKLSASDTIGTINLANTVVLLMDCQQAMEKQDLIIANYVIAEGRSLVIAVNKWDLVENKNLYTNSLSTRLEKVLPQVKGVPIVYLSALTQYNVDMLLDECKRIYDLWNIKISTSNLNRWLKYATLKHPLPLQKNNRRIKLKYITQTNIRPPTFKLFTNSPEEISDNYQQYLINDLRKTFSCPGVPIRLNFAATENPYAKKD